MDVGFIGMGMMGKGMTRNLLKGGHKVTVFNRTRSRAEEMKSYGAVVADTLTEVAKQEAVITMLSDDSAVEEVAFGTSGLIPHLGSDSLHISMSTLSVAMAERLTKAHSSKSQLFVSAPVFGRPQMAEAGKLFILVAGDPGVLHRCQPLFGAMGQQTFVIGERPFVANTVKLTGNFLIASMLESLGEAFALIKKSGVDSDQFLHILTSTLFPAPIYSNYGGMIAQNQYEPAGFKLSLGAKDVRLALAAAEEHRVPMPVASVIRDHFLSAMARGYQDLDWAALGLICQEDSGL